MSAHKNTEKSIIYNEFEEASNKRLQENRLRFIGCWNEIGRNAFISLAEKTLYKLLYSKYQHHLIVPLTQKNINHFVKNLKKKMNIPSGVIIKTIDDASQLQKHLFIMSSERSNHKFCPIFDYYFIDARQRNANPGGCFCAIMDLSSDQFIHILWLFLTNKFTDVNQKNLFSYVIGYSQSAGFCKRCAFRFFIQTQGLKLFVDLFEKKIKYFMRDQNILYLLCIIRILNHLLPWNIFMRHLFQKPVFYKKLFNFWSAFSRFYRDYNLYERNPKLSVHISLQRLVFDIQFFEDDYPQNCSLTVFVLRKSKVLLEYILNEMSYFLHAIMHQTTLFWKHSVFEYILQNKHINRIVYHWTDFYKNSFDYLYSNLPDHFEQFTTVNEYYTFGRDFTEKYLWLNSCIHPIQKRLVYYDYRYNKSKKAFILSTKYDEECEMLKCWQSETMKRDFPTYEINPAFNIYLFEKMGPKYHNSKVYWQELKYYWNEYINHKKQAYRNIECQYYGCRKHKRFCDKFYQCSQCKFAKYCSRKCQKRDWNLEKHRLVCSVLKTFH
eukprot:86746_1